MKSFQILIMRVSYILGLLALLAGAIVRLAWFIDLLRPHDPRNWFICAGSLFLCSLASHSMSQVAKE
jgi:hypothetical protein